MHYIAKGKGFYKVNDITYDLSSRNIFTIFPGDIVHYWTLSDDPWSFYWFAFNGISSIKLLNDAGITRSNPTIIIPEKINIIEPIEAMIKALNEKNQAYLTEISGYLYLTLACLQQSYSNNLSNAKAKNNVLQYIKNAQEFIKHNYFQDISVTDLANFVNLERTYFSKIFALYTGTSPREYIIQYRINKVCSLLRETDLTISEICQCIGITEEYYFSRLFKKKLGITPSEYRKLHYKSI